MYQTRAREKNKHTVLKYNNNNEEEEEDIIYNKNKRTLIYIYI